MAKKVIRYVNRELSWLEFNQRVLDEAQAPDVPLLEQLLFLTIVASNLDEFYMVRVGGLTLMEQAGITTPDVAELSPVEQLKRIHKRARRMICDIYGTYRQMIPALAEHGIRRLLIADLTPPQIDDIESRFLQTLFPVVTPMALRVGESFPMLSNLGLYMIVKLAPEPRKRTPRYALVPLSKGLDRLMPIAVGDGAHPYILVEDVIQHFVGHLFPGQEVLEAVPFRATRNADMQVKDEFAVDLVSEMEKVLRRRKTGGCVRLEIDKGASKTTTEFLSKLLHVKDEAVLKVDGPLHLTDFRALLGTEGTEHLRYETWLPQGNADIDPSKSIFSQIAARDIALSLPFERFDPIVKLVQEAADDPDVLAIKQVLYRTSSNSPIIKALRRAAENGKSVTVLVELKARFDEANNIEWARRLERNGVQVIYGIKGLKTHAKICLVVRREPEGVVRYMHFGTGNYNDSTAKLYTDVGLLTRNPDLGMDASAFFNAVGGYSEPQQYLKLVQSPISMLDTLVDLIDGETERKRQGHKAQILAKMNSLVDPTVIEALYRASAAGVDVRLNVRGICCLRPGVKGLSENIKVISIVDRFLEHSRIFYFLHGGAKKMYISSADWMPRNLKRRIELMVPVEDTRCRKKLMHVLKTCMNDSVKGRRIQPDGGHLLPAAEGSRKGGRSQESLYRGACDAAAEVRQAKRTKFEPHLPPGAD
ncbi:MAG: polyphosphate kinase 1 [Verrucomicrobia bacterium]|jgi:polyphosphate kinase|nr:polyphosphate kinase 1 [Verrucomicrobiota bacterium]